MPKIKLNTNKIKALCASNKITLNQLLLASDISRQNWYHHLKNNTLPLNVLEKICYHLNARPNDIFEIEYNIQNVIDCVEDREENYVASNDILTEIANDAQSIIEKVEILKLGRK